MSFLVLLILILVEKFSNGRHYIQQDTLWLKLLNHIETKSQNRPTACLAIIELTILPVIIIGLLLYLVSGIFHGSLVFILDIVIMLYALGRIDFYQLLGSFRDAWRRNDIEGIKIAAQRDLGISSEDDDKEELLKQAQDKLLWYSYEGFFAVIFWYMLLGPLPALFYRLIAFIETLTTSPAIKAKAQQIRYYLDWLPSRMLIYSFCLVGNFSATHETAIKELLNTKTSASEFISKAGRAATQTDHPTKEQHPLSSLDILWSLLIRTAVLWYAIYALIVIFVFN